MIEGDKLSISEDARQVLREIGLNAYEIDAYVALLEGGQMTAMEISKKAKLPYSKIYEVLNSLKNNGWIKSIEARPTKYYPIQPLEALATAKIRLEDKYMGWEQTIARELQPLYDKRELVERPDILILHGQQGVMAKLEETLKKASKEIMIAAPEFKKHNHLGNIFSRSLPENPREYQAYGRGESWGLEESKGISWRRRVKS